eukprot:1157541-Pelagomonas_calceolata.AAC.7
MSMLPGAIHEISRLPPARKDVQVVIFSGFLMCTWTGPGPHINPLKIPNPSYSRYCTPAGHYVSDKAWAAQVLKAMCTRPWAQGPSSTSIPLICDQAKHLLAAVSEPLTCAHVKSQHSMHPFLYIHTPYTPPSFYQSLAVRGFGVCLCKGSGTLSSTFITHNWHQGTPLLSAVSEA